MDARELANDRAVADDTEAAALLEMKVLRQVTDDDAGVDLAVRPIVVQPEMYAFG
jgi:hypothetical protein